MIGFIELVANSGSFSTDVIQKKEQSLSLLIYGILMKCPMIPRRNMILGIIFCTLHMKNDTWYNLSYEN